MGYHEKKWFQEIDKGKILKYKRYADDIFCMFGNEKDAEYLFEFFNCQQKSIKFTLEKESYNFCHFLTFLSKMKESLFQHQSVKRKHQLGCLKSLIVLHHRVKKLAL